MTPATPETEKKKIIEEHQLIKEIGVNVWEYFKIIDARENIERE